MRIGEEWEKDATVAEAVAHVDHEFSSGLSNDVTGEVGSGGVTADAGAGGAGKEMMHQWGWCRVYTCCGSSCPVMAGSGRSSTCVHGMGIRFDVSFRLQVSDADVEDSLFRLFRGACGAVEFIYRLQEVQSVSRSLVTF